MRNESQSRLLMEKPDPIRRNFMGTMKRLPHPSPGRPKALASPLCPPFPRESAPDWKCSTSTAACSNFSVSRNAFSALL
ncbi:hypothetical protein Q7C36_010078 [Tachysurus vachellii]|uniref:Uncharacterized protein n=1 Tax=Tachysurus vachellii TaxID=175792 RepID=A0AA88N2B9_TACVA|nr:hypothetical protein Q7C36_010078 [Tachysurus vachellii]